MNNEEQITVAGKPENKEDSFIDNTVKELVYFSPEIAGGLLLTIQSEMREKHLARIETRKVELAEAESDYEAFERALNPTIK